jgi:hypothetical protein
MRWYAACREACTCRVGGSALPSRAGAGLTLSDVPASSRTPARTRFRPTSMLAGRPAPLSFPSAPPAEFALTACRVDGRHLARVTSNWGRVHCSGRVNPAVGMHLAPRGAAALLRVVRAAPPVHSSLGLARCPALLPREALRPWRPSAAAGAFRCLYARPRYAKPRSTGSTGSTGAADANAAEAAEAIDIQPPFAVRAGLVGAATALMTPLFPVIGFNQLVRLSAHWRTHAVRHSPTYTHTHSRTARARTHTHTHTKPHVRRHPHTRSLLTRAH